MWFIYVSDDTEKVIRSHCLRAQKSSSANCLKMRVLTFYISEYNNEGNSMLCPQCYLFSTAYVILDIDSEARIICTDGGYWMLPTVTFLCTLSH